MDVSLILAALFGGIIGVAGDTIGRMGARRDAMRQRLEAREDALLAEKQAERARLAETRVNRAREAAESILAAYRDNPFNFGTPEDEALERFRQIQRVLGYEYVHLGDHQARERLLDVSRILDTLNINSSLCNLSRVEVGFVARKEAKVLLGEFLRGDPLTPASPQWNDIMEAGAVAREEWQRVLQQRGSTVRLWPFRENAERRLDSPPSQGNSA
ncbi:hypothetical protein ABZ613_21735 [Streptomyces collinus]|uniref:hypothetical protein n=1 Tax=Streptomyces collinus TaxID=42684 RepID=UPI0033FF6E4C